MSDIGYWKSITYENVMKLPLYRTIISRFITDGPKNYIIVKLFTSRVFILKLKIVGPSILLSELPIINQ